MRLSPFRAIRPLPAFVERVACPPYDVVNREEAAAFAKGKPYSFMRIIRGEIDLPDDVDAYDSRVYQRARRTLQERCHEGVLVQDQTPALFVYRLIRQGRSQTGVVGCVHVDDYDRDLIKKHERTRPDKENDRTRHILELDAAVEPVFLAYRGDAAVHRAIASAVATRPLYDFRAADEVQHTVWRVRDPEAIVQAFASVAVAYIADGHHRCASAARAARERRAQQWRRDGHEAYLWFPAVLFPAAELCILPYHRLVKDLHGLTPADFVARLRKLGKVAPATAAVPERPHQFAFYLDHGWHRLELDTAGIDARDPIASLDADLLQKRILGPILGVGDPRTDKRLDFVGGSRGPQELARRVDSGEMALGVALHPVTIEQLFAVADAGSIMPPKSTWFEPKLASGLFVHRLSG